jgi:hypothetical protein
MMHAETLEQARERRAREKAIIADLIEFSRRGGMSLSVWIREHTCPHCGQHPPAPRYLVPDECLAPERRCPCPPPGAATPEEQPR